ncbi:hypothetical protein ACFCX6_37360 [Streptomyces sp. NPDC056353]|uniref:TRADD-N-associated membrane domain-containing protein n=1 Tax=Streptomyces sp. NPDC056353 TaxID=3345792 RepID=UPI0035E06789
MDYYAVVMIILGSAVAVGAVARAVTPMWDKRLQADVNKEITRIQSGISPGQAGHEEKFTEILTEYYAFGVVQARRSFTVSLSFTVIGGVVLIGGIVMAVFKAETTGEQYANAVISVAGLLTGAIGTLFHRRADKALKHMSDQVKTLRQDMRAERDAGQAIRLMEEVEDPTLKAHLQAALILKFSAAKLPELGGMLKPADPLVEPSANGAVPQQQSENTTS